MKLLFRKVRHLTCRICKITEYRVERIKPQVLEAIKPWPTSRVYSLNRMREDDSGKNTSNASKRYQMPNDFSGLSADIPGHSNISVLFQVYKMFSGNNNEDRSTE